MVCIFASQVAACIDKNPFQSVAQTRVDIWKREFPLKYDQASVRNNAESEFLLPPLVIRGNLNSRDTSKQVEILKETPLVAIPKDVIAIENPKIKDSKIACEKLIEEVNKKRGVEQETKGIETYEKRKKTSVTQRNATLYKKYIDSGVLLCGRVDGFDGEKIVELKTRRYRLFTDIPDYERIQVMTYMFLTGARKCEWTQVFDDEMDCRNIEFDEAEWEEIRQEIIEFAKIQVQLYNDQDMQNELLLQI
jgi:hypothetical protein